MKIINSITVRNLVNISNHSITLPENSDHLILVGFNGTGKSSILRALAYGDNSAIEIDLAPADAHVVVWDRKAVNDTLRQLELTKDRPTVLIIDDIEIGLDPQKQNTFLNELTAGYPNLQVIGSTHSPFVLAGAENTAAYNLESDELHEHLAWMGFKEIAERVFGVVES